MNAPCFGGAAVVVPEVEVDEVDRLLERLAVSTPSLRRPSMIVLARLRPCRWCSHDLLRLLVDAIDQRLGVAWRQTSFMLGLSRGVVRALCRDLGKSYTTAARTGRASRSMPLRPLMWQVAQVGTNMSRVVSVVGRRVEVQQIFLRCEHDAVLRFLVDFDLRMVGPHVALAAGGGQPGDARRKGVPRVAGGAGADGAVGVGLADAVALSQPLGNRRRLLPARQADAAAVSRARDEIAPQRRPVRALSPFSP